MNRATQMQMKRLLEKQYSNLRHDIAHAKAQVAGLQTELLRVEIALEDITQELDEMESD